MIGCTALALLSSPIVAHAAEPSPMLAAGASPSGGAPDAEAPGAAGAGASKPAEATTTAEAPTSKAPAEEETAASVEQEEEALSREAEARLGAEEAAALERIAREAGAEAERTGNPAATAGPTSCLVPSLKGDTLRAARRALARAHCRLGRVSEPRTRGARLVVTRQGRHAGAVLSDEAAISIKLGRPARRRR